MVGAPVNIRLNPLKALAVYVSGEVAVQIICEPETSSEPSNARVPAGNSTPEVTGTGPIGPLQIPGTLQKLVSSGNNKTPITSDPSRSARAIVGEKTANASVTAIPISADFRRILFPSLSGGFGQPYFPGAIFYNLGRHNEPAHTLNQDFHSGLAAQESIHPLTSFGAVESKFCSSL
jgi:hypothetical protein